MNTKNYILDVLNADSRTKDLAAGIKSAISELLIRPASILMNDIYEKYKDLTDKYDINNENLTKEELSNIASNIFAYIYNGSYAWGIVRIVVSDKVEIVLPADTKFQGANGKYYLPLRATKFTTGSLVQVSGEDGYYTAPIIVVAEGTGSEYNLDENEITGLNTTVKNVIKLTSTKITRGADAMTMTQFRDFVKNTIISRQLLTANGIRGLRKYYDNIRDITVVGYGDDDMGRDEVIGVKYKHRDHNLDFLGKRRADPITVSHVAKYFAGTEEDLDELDIADFTEVPQQFYNYIAKDNNNPDRISTEFLVNDDFTRDPNELITYISTSITLFNSSGNSANATLVNVDGIEKYNTMILRDSNSVNQKVCLVKSISGNVIIFVSSTWSVDYTGGHAQKAITDAQIIGRGWYAAESGYPLGTLIDAMEVRLEDGCVVLGAKTNIFTQNQLFERLIQAGGDKFEDAILKSLTITPITPTPGVSPIPRDDGGTVNVGIVNPAGRSTK